MNQEKTPLFSKLQAFARENPISFHVPGHKNGNIFHKEAEEYFQSLLTIDATELPSLDDLHAPEGVIAEAQALASEYFQVEETFFLVGGSTSGNLAMILATCGVGDTVIVQRNSHKSIMNGLELTGTKPVFLSPDFDHNVNRYTSPSLNSLKEALEKYPHAKAIILTYPDYFGKTYPLKEMIQLAHQCGIPVLVDEAHGVHFRLGDPFPPSAVTLGADIVVQSAHKMAPAMTMSSFLHFNSSLVAKEKVSHYLQVIQSSSPSYPLMASLDLARAFLATRNKEDITRVIESVKEVREILTKTDVWTVLPLTNQDDPLKITLQMNEGYIVSDIIEAFIKHKIYPELITHNQILLIHGLQTFYHQERLKKVVKSTRDYLKNRKKHATINITKLFPEKVQELALSYESMKQLSYRYVPVEQGIGSIAAEAVIPYPPGIPLILKGERITSTHLDVWKQLEGQGIRFQQRHRGMKIFSNEEETNL